MPCEEINKNYKNCFPGIILSAIIFSLLFLSAYTESYTVTLYASKNQQPITPIIMSASDPSAEIRFDPQTYRFFVERGIGPGYRFNTTIELYNVTNLFAWQIRVYFNNTLLNATNVYYHPDEPIHKVNHIEVAPIIKNDYNETHGYVQHAISAIYPDYVNVTADDYPLGVGICIIEFEVLMKPSTGKTSESKLTLDNSDTCLRKDPGTIIPCTKENGLYRLISANIRVPIDYPTIQEAIDAANPNEVVFVYNGSYNENVVINKTLMLIGQDANTVIVNGTNDTAINISSVNNAIVDGFTITSANYGIYAYNCRNLTVSGNFIIGNTYGIYTHCYAEAGMISYCDNGLITRNK